MLLSIYEISHAGVCMNRFFAVTALIALTTAGCSILGEGTTTTLPPSDTTTTTTIADVKVVFPGYCYNSSAEILGYLWIDGAMVRQTNGLVQSRAYSSCQSGADIYACGSVEKTNTIWSAAYWKNNALVVLTNPAGTNYPASSSDIYVNGSDVYVAGLSKTVTAQWPATIWVNGVPQLLEASGSSTAYGIAVNGSDVWTVGSGNGGYPVYWKNGAKTQVSSNTGCLYDVTVDNGNVYMCGNITIGSGTTNYAYYWMNGISHRLTNTVNSHQYIAIEIAVDGWDIYVSGYYFDSSFNVHACYWKNEQFFELDDPVGTEAQAMTILIDGDTVYFGGYYANGSRYQACYWEDGVFHTLSDLGYESKAGAWY